MITISDSQPAIQAAARPIEPSAAAAGEEGAGAEVLMGNGAADGKPGSRWPGAARRGAARRGADLT
jgi:hypothetical protein